MRTLTKILSLLCISVVATAALRAHRADAQTRITPELLTTAKSLGDKNAPILVEEFTDFQCPACRQLFLQTTSRLIDDYVVTGKVYLVHHDYPLVSEHPYAMQAAEWANAAALTGKFEKVELALFTDQNSWGTTGKVEDVIASVLTSAEMKRARELVNRPEIQDAIEHDAAMGRNLGIPGTPSLYVTYKGKRSPLPPGPISYSILKTYLDYLLKH